MSSYLYYGTNAISAAAKVAYDKVYDYWYYSEERYPNEIKRINNQSSVFKRATHFFGKPVLIIDNLYLGSAFNAASYYQLKDTGIDIVINATNEITNYYPEHFTYKNYNLADVNSDSVAEYLEDAYKFIKEHNNKKILVHCFMGASRSASLMTYYLMKEHNMTMNEAINFLINKREIVNINTTFASELKDSLTL